MTPWDTALEAAQLLCANLFDGVLRVEIAGTLRRLASYIDAGGEAGNWQVPGIELVAVPNIGRERSLNGLTPVNFLYTRVERLGYKVRWGDYGGQMYAPLPGDAGWIPARVYTAEAGNFGATWFMRTGPAEAVRRALDSWLLDGMSVRDDWLLKRDSTVLCLTEEQFFRYAFGREVIAPHLRTEMGL